MSGGRAGEGMQMPTPHFNVWLQLHNIPMTENIVLSKKALECLSCWKTSGLCLITVLNDLFGISFFSFSLCYLGNSALFPRFGKCDICELVHGRDSLVLK